MGVTLLNVQCRWCDEITCIPVDKEGFEKWRAGELIQNALPGLSVDDREQLISRTCPSCWAKIFKETGDE